MIYIKVKSIDSAHEIIKLYKFNKINTNKLKIIYKKKYYF